MFLVDGVEEGADMISPGEIDPGELYRMFVICHISPHVFARDGHGLRLVARVFPKPARQTKANPSHRAGTNRVGSFVSVADCRLNGSCLLIAPSDCERSRECYSDVRRVATELGFDGASGCHAKHFRALRLEFCACVKKGEQ